LTTRFLRLHSSQQLFRGYRGGGEATQPLSHSATQPLSHSATQPLSHSATQPLSHHSRVEVDEDGPFTVTVK
jgi:hypothetical protein